MDRCPMETLIYNINNFVEGFEYDELDFNFTLFINAHKVQGEFMYVEDVSD